MENIASNISASLTRCEHLRELLAIALQLPSLATVRQSEFNSGENANKKAPPGGAFLLVTSRRIELRLPG